MAGASIRSFAIIAYAASPSQASRFHRAFAVIPYYAFLMIHEHFFTDLLYKFWLPKALCPYQYIMYLECASRVERHALTYIGVKYAMLLVAEPYPPGPCNKPLRGGAWWSRLVQALCAGLRKETVRKKLPVARKFRQGGCNNNE